MSSVPTTGFAISEYHDTAAIYRQVRELLARPPLGLKPEALQTYLRYYEEKCPKSKAAYEEARQYIPGGVQHNLAFTHPFPLMFTRCEGAALEDADGNTYIDFLQAGGPTVLGSNPPAVREQIEDLLRTCGPVTGLFHEYELKLARFIAERFPAVEMFRMLGSGTEACMGAIRLARVATGKKRIIKIGGAYHGWSDQLSYGMRIPGTRNFNSHGIPGHIFRYTHEVYPNDIAALKKRLQRNSLRGGTAAVLVEPLGGESGTRPVDKDYNAQVRELCDHYGALMVFDEVVTGFRIGMSGAQGYFGIKPDLTVFGKAVTGGYPSAGGLGGKREYMEMLAGGVGGKAIKKKVHVGGTLAANPLSCAGGYFTLMEMERVNACELAGHAGDRLTRGLQGLIEKHKLPYVAYNQGSICHLETAGVLLMEIDLKQFWKIPSVLKEVEARTKLMQEMGAAYMAEGLVTLSGSRLYTSAACTDDIIDEALVRFDRVLHNIEGV
ncbi:MAG: aminotransferase class III-fold pyridoxal phosphate-dependent enzyme [Candidatus Hydrogenedens sp.]|nr:aminotransferase class III-fold pyridoxal phosphate-dependent enzyme [Candidatus Hydrogenedens sp.]